MSVSPILLPPFTIETATLKARLAENAWNSCDPDLVVPAYSEDCVWRNRDQFIVGRVEIRKLLEQKWSREFEYRLAKEVWGFRENRMAVRFRYEWRDAQGRWFRSYGNELWEFDSSGLIRRRESSVNDIAIQESERRFRWPSPGPRPLDHEGIPGLE